METHLVIINTDNWLGGSTCKIICFPDDFQAPLGHIIKHIYKNVFQLRFLLFKRALVVASGQEICAILTLHVSEAKYSVLVE